jgi:hypothetical protein
MFWQIRGKQKNATNTDNLGSAADGCSQKIVRRCRCEEELLRTWQSRLKNGEYFYIPLTGSLLKKTVRILPESSASRSRIDRVQCTAPMLASKLGESIILFTTLTANQLQTSRKTPAKYVRPRNSGISRSLILILGFTVSP